MPRSRASSAAPSDMATPRRSTRIAARTPSVAGSDAGSDVGDRRVDRRSKTPTNAGQVGRLTTTRPSGSRAYGATISDDRESAEPETMDAPTSQHGFAASFLTRRDGVRVSATRTLTEGEEHIRVPPTIPEGHETSTPARASSHRSASVQGSVSNKSDRSNKSNPPAESNQPAELNPPAAPTDDSRPVTRDTNESSNVPTKTWNDICEAAILGVINYHPAWYDVVRRILRNTFGIPFAVLMAISKITAVVLGFIYSMVFAFLLFDVIVRSLPGPYGTTASAYMRERSSKIITFLPGADSIINQPVSIPGYMNSGVISEQTLKLMQEDIDMLKNYVPDTIMLHYNKKTGRTEIPGNFWDALRDKLTAEGLVSSNHGNPPSWTDFLQHNKAHLNAHLSDAVDAKLKDAIKNDAPVDKDTFIGIIQDQVQQLETRIADMDSSWDHKINKEFAALPKGQLSAISHAFLLENSWKALHNVDFFSRSMGAVVDPHLTSPTMAKGNFVKRALEKLAWIPGDLPPAAVLVGWEEPTDCWCAAAGSGKAQVGVIMPHKIVPETFVVEHIPRDGTLDIGSAPRGMEVWVEVEDEGVRAALPSKGEKGEDGPGEKFVRVGSFEYRVDSPNHIRTVTLNSGLLTPVNKVVVRVTGTWGRDWACLYRLRMYGRPAEDFNGFSE